MKRKIFAIATLLAFITLAFAFRPIPQKLAGTLFECTNRATPFNPAAYIVNTLDPVVDCPGQQKVCMIDVPTSDIYTTGPNNGKPKVDIITGATGELSDDIAFAISASHPGDGYAGSNGRYIYESF